MIHIIILKKRCGGDMRFNNVFLHQSIIIAKRFSITNNIAIVDRYLEFNHIHIFLCKNTIKNLSNNNVNLLNNDKNGS